MISAEIIADSRNALGQRITTYLLCFPRIVLAEFNTHRMLSRNSASSRAIPFKKMVEKVTNNPFIPIAWQKDHKGMQGAEYFTGHDARVLEGLWLSARDQAVAYAEEMSDYKEGLTKQLVNRGLETYMYHKVIVTATEWENFFALRAHPAAEIHIAKLAELMLEAYNDSVPKLLETGQWHIPFGDKMDVDRIKALYQGFSGNTEEPDENYYNALDDLRVKIATARCARVSYDNYEGGDDYEKDIELHDRLSEMGHMSPFEHCAQPLINGTSSGNFIGWLQYRKLFGGENKTEPRVIPWM